jgi:hypothetical protein
MIINLDINEITLYDINLHNSILSNNKTQDKSRMMDEINKCFKLYQSYNKNYKIFSLAKFLCWKLFAIIKYSEFDFLIMPSSMETIFSNNNSSNKKFKESEDFE